MRKCRHARQRYKVATIYGPVGEHAFWLNAGQGAIQVIGQCTCEQCGQVVTWGPSNDELDEVKVEIRAIEVVNARAAQRPDLVTTDEFYGWTLHECGLDVDCNIPRDDAEWTGWLARCIWTHCDDHPNTDKVKP